MQVPDRFGDCMRRIQGSVPEILTPVRVGAEWTAAMGIRLAPKWLAPWSVNRPAIET